jgi:hypothetical protein
MTLRWLKRFDDEGHRWQLWPVRLSLCLGFAARSWFQVHGWQTGCELTPDRSSGGGCVPGVRHVYGQTYHLGPLKILFGRERTESERELVDTWCRYQELANFVLRGSADNLDDMRRHWALMSELGRLVFQKDATNAEVLRAAKEIAGVMFTPGGRA